MSNWVGRAKRALLTQSAFSNIGRSGQPSASYRRVFAFESLEPRLVLAVAPGLVATPQTYSGALNGKIVFTSGGHGWQYNTTLGRYATDRGENNDMVEDFGNQEQMTAFADYALQAGATVVAMRPVGHQLNEVVLDNDSPGVTFSGAWSNSTSTKFYDEDYGATADSIPYRYAGTVTGTETATATYTPNIPAAGFYPVYTWVLYGTDRTGQTYTINHTGGSTQVTVDHSIVGSGWVYLGTYHFDQGSSSVEGSVVITNKTAATGKVVIADAIRFGNGMGDYVFTGSGATTISGYPREEENSYHWLARSVGQGTTVASVIGTASSANVSAPSDYAEYMYHGAFGGAVYIGFHSNAGGGRGARGLIDTDVADQTPHQAGTNGLADILGKQINQDMQALNGVFEYNWTTGTTSTYTGQFGEINLGGSAEMDATIIEVAFHDDVSDAAIMRDPNGREQIARSTLQGAVQYFSLYGSPVVANTNLPSAPTNVRVASNTNGAVTLNWSAGLSSPASVYGNVATGYKVYASVDGYGFDGGRVVSGVGTTTLTITGLDPNTPYYFIVTATNAGGESKPTEVVAALPTGGTKQVLIVNGFDRYDRTQNFRASYLSSLTIDRVFPRYNNSHDYVVQFASAIQASKPGVHFASTSNEAVISGAVNLSDYDSVIWILGTESTDDETFSAAEQTKVTNFVNAGGNFFVSGSEIGWDLDRPDGAAATNPTAADRTFFRNTLGAAYSADDANTYTSVVTAGGIFSGMSSFTFANGAAFSQLDSQYQNVAYPDVLTPQAGAVSALTYSGGLGGTAAIQVAGTGGKGNVVVFAFPFESMTVAARRASAMGKILDFFAVAPPAPGIAIETQVNGQDADTGTGPILAAGGTASFTYVLTNTGNVPLSSIIVADDNGTPGNSADDFNATFVGGDANGNSQLDVGETWTYSSSRTVSAGQFTGTGTVTAVGNAQSIASTDPVNFFGSAPGITAKVFVNGNDADSLPGPALPIGSSATFAYLISNAGNSALSNVLVVDDNGTPGNTADDVTPTFSGGDANNNGQLDVAETWIYTSARTVVTGQYTNTGAATASDIIGQVVASSDTSNYFGGAPANADFNGDMIVDGGDFIMWRKNNGLTAGATQSQGDANGDGMVNNDDYDIWRSQFGTSPGAGSSVAKLAKTAETTSEPSTTASSLVAATSSVAPSNADSASQAKDVVLTTMAGHPGVKTAQQTESNSNTGVRARRGAIVSTQEWQLLIVDLAKYQTQRDAGDDAQPPGTEQQPNPVAGDGPGCIAQTSVVGLQLGKKHR